MPVHVSDLNGDNGSYFGRVPERLVLEGYRHWTAGYETGSVVPWEMAWTLYSDLLGDREGRVALGELAHFIRTLGRCARCPLRAFPFGAHHVCREECLTLGLIAGQQHRDARTVELCVGALACPLREGDVAQAAAGFAEALVRLEKRLLPIPPSAIEDILARSRPRTVH